MYAYENYKIVKKLKSWHPCSHDKIFLIWGYFQERRHPNPNPITIHFIPHSMTKLICGTALNIGRAEVYHI
jgi:hypothetical protein